MKRTSTHLMRALTLALLAGCSASSNTGSAQFAVFIPYAGASAISRVSVTASAADIPAASVDLVSSNGIRGGTLGNLPAGANRAFLAQAFDASGTLLFEGSASGVSISANQTSLIAITLLEPGAPPASLSEPPVIDSLVVSSTTVLAGKSLFLQAAAHGLHPGEALAYAWSSSSGSASSDASASTSWTAPTSPGTQTLTFTVTDASGLSSSASLEVTVLSSTSSEGQGAARFTVSFNSFPQVTALRATPAPLAVGQATSVSVLADDLDGDSLSYAWSASCAGTWAEASSSSARFTPSTPPTSSCDACDLTVSVSDGRGGQTTGTASLCVSTTPAPQHFNPLILRTYSSALPGEMISAGRVLTYEVAASDPEGSALSFSWTANTGTLGTPANSRTTWTAPSCVSEDTTPTITATVTNAFNLKATSSFTVMGLRPCLFSAWAATNDMASPRSNHTATPLKNGKVLVSGGLHKSSLTGAELYDPDAGTWSTTGPLISARHLHAAALLPDNKVLVAGGYNGSYLASAEVYDPASGTWSTTGAMLSPRYNHTATPLNNGKVLVSGGWNSTTGYLSAELYDPALRTWSATKNTLSSSRAYHTATPLLNGEVLVTGGRNSSFLATAELYDPALGTWRKTGAMASPRASHTAVRLPDGKVLVAGGTNRSVYLATAEVYDPDSGTWSTVDPMTSPRSNFAALLLPNGKVLVAGGQNGTKYLAAAEVYDPDTRTWSATDAMTSSRSTHTATPLSNGKLLVSGGTFGSTSLAAAELYTTP